MINLKVTFDREQGMASERTICKQGSSGEYVEVNMNYFFSRALTKTVSESGYNGIFSAKSSFRRGVDADVETIDFGCDLDLYTYDTSHDFMQELHRRVDLVEKAFNDKYPQSSNSCTSTFN